MPKNFYQSAQGLQVNIDQMRILNERTVAVGNMQVNARGDLVTRSGEIIKTRNEIMKDHYSRQTQPVVKYNPNKKKQNVQTIEESAPVVTAPNPVPVITDKAPFAATNNTDLRGSLANEVMVDLVEPAPTPGTKTIKRI